VAVEMKRFTIEPRADWQKIIESQGLIHHSVDEKPYWDESVYYEFNAAQVDELEAATNELHAMCLNAVQYVIDQGNLYKILGIPDWAIPLIEKSWNDETPAIYGRFDLSYDGKSPPKMLEYNADTPTSLPEAAIIQWYWQQDKFKDHDQFNSIHERLIAKWSELKEYLNPGPLYFTGLDAIEDYINLQYMIETAQQGGLETKEIDISQIGWHSVDKRFIDNEMYDITNVFKLYPWEWLLNEEFGKNIAECFNQTFWMEPPWKLILSSKGILPILWALNPGHKNLLPAYFKKVDHLGDNYVVKPIFSREGSNISVVQNGKEIIATDGDYGEEGFIYQELCSLPNFDNNYPVIGSWVVDGQSAGIGIRESNTLITGNLSRFVPHIFK
jgi:glutathionylspermidine synthase